MYSVGSVTVGEQLVPFMALTTALCLVGIENLCQGPFSFVKDSDWTLVFCIFPGKTYEITKSLCRNHFCLYQGCCINNYIILISQTAFITMVNNGGSGL